YRIVPKCSIACAVLFGAQLAGHLFQNDNGTAAVYPCCSLGSLKEFPTRVVGYARQVLIG
ncbi:MAG TPA: hypothetical protein VKN36_12805, partial [Eudoraea sp.]|nr:hypothetical protein [Eudoraea sp.]